MSESTEQPFVSIPNVAVTPPPAADAPAVHHANWLHSMFAAIEAALANPIVQAAVVMLPPSYQKATGVIEAGVIVGDKLTEPKP